MTIARLAAVAAMLILSGNAFAAEPVRHVSIYMQSFDQSARAPDGRPDVAVGKHHAQAQ
jgi:hypothetical protein